MSKYKNLLLDDLAAENFTPPVKKIVLLGKEPFTKEQAALMESLKSRFSQAEFILTPKIPPEHCDIIAPLDFYPVAAPTRYPLELSALFSPGDYLMIYEDTYSSVRLAGKFDLVYRIFLRPLLWAVYMGFSLLLVVFFYLYYLILAPFSKDNQLEKN